MKIIRPIVVTAITSSNVPENDYPEFSGATTYALGARVIDSDAHAVYESLQAGNTGHAPQSNPSWWVKVGATNRWRMFDASITSQTSNLDTISVKINPGERFDAIALMNIDATQIQVTITNVDGDVLFDRTASTAYSAGITDWYQYFYEPIARRTDFVVLDLPQYLNCYVTVTLTNPGHTVKCGECVIGLQRTIGKVQHGASIGIQDYSVKQRDTFGNYTLLERAYNKRANFTLVVDNRVVDSLQTMLASYRAIPIVYIGSKDYGSTFIYGFYKDFTIEIAYPTHSICSLELEGLT